MQMQMQGSAAVEAWLGARATRMVFEVQSQSCPSLAEADGG